jgi:hypothetical protein
MPVIVGVDGLAAKLRRLVAEADTDVKFVVGYGSPVALYVHENREQKLKGLPRPSGIGAYWGPRGRPGFLLDVAREMRGELRDFLVAQMKRGIKLRTALGWAAIRLMKESQRNVPVEYGDLRDSAFARVG